jgi:hypothetical protein
MLVSPKTDSSVAGHIPSLLQPVQPGMTAVRGLPVVSTQREIDGDDPQSPTSGVGKIRGNWPVNCVRLIGRGGRLLEKAHFYLRRLDWSEKAYFGGNEWMNRGPSNMEKVIFRCYSILARDSIVGSIGDVLPRRVCW